MAASEQSLSSDILHLGYWLRRTYSFCFNVLFTAGCHLLNLNFFPSVCVFACRITAKAPQSCTTDCVSLGNDVESIRI